MNCLLNINPISIHENVYIKLNGGGVDALQAFGTLLNEGIYVSGFVSDDINLQGVEIFNKRIFHKDELVDKSVIILNYLSNDKELGIYEISSDLKNDVFVFGAGYVGSEVYKILQNSSKNILAYIDTDPEKIGGKLNGIEICDTNVLQKKAVDEYSLIIAADIYHEIDEIVNAVNPKINRFYWSTDDGNRVWINKEMGDCISFHEIDTLCNLARGKRVYLYGAGDSAEKTRQYLHLLDLEFGGYLINDDADKNKSVQTQYVEEILYEKDYLIVIMEDIENSIRLLTEMGLKYAVDFVPVHPLDSSIYFARKNILDINLGHSFVNNSGDEGFYEYSKQTDRYKIAVLGGSTTDGGVYPFKSWPEALYEKLEGVTIYNFGVSAYTSTQEMIKLMRDVLDFNPDMVITYDGYNDSIQKDQNFYSFPYLKEIFVYSEKGIAGDCWWMSSRGNVCSSKKKTKKDNFEMWISNIVFMREICRLRGICFYAFLQPMLPTKEGNIDKRETAIMLLRSFLTDVADQQKFDFRDRIKSQNICEQYDYIFDLSAIFDGISDIYMDICHVNERGNEIIADEIYKRIREKICMNEKHKERIVLFGTGGGFQETVNSEFLENYDVVAVADSNPKFKGFIVSGYCIITPEQIKNYNYDFIYVTSAKYYHEIRSQLINKYRVSGEKIKLANQNIELTGSESDRKQLQYLRNAIIEMKLEGFQKNNSLIKIASHALNRNEISSYWNVHTVNGNSWYISAEESYTHCLERFNMYPSFRDFCQMDRNHSDDLILDYGCGTGNDTVWLMLNCKAKHIIGMDVSETALKNAQFRLALHNIKGTSVELIQIEEAQDKLLLEDGSIDFVNCQGVLMHTSDPVKIIKEFYRVLKKRKSKESCANIMVYNKDSIWYHLYVAYYLRYVNNKMFADLGREKVNKMTVDDIFRCSTDGIWCPKAECWTEQEFVSILQKAGFDGVEYKGGYFDSLELKIAHMYLSQAIDDSRLEECHKNFLREVSFNEEGYPVYNGKLCGVGGAYLCYM